MVIVACLLSFSALAVSIIMLARTENLNNATEKLIERTDKLMNETERLAGNRTGEKEEPEKTIYEEMKENIEEYGVINANRRRIEMARLERENEELKKKLRGDRVCDGYCEECENGIIIKGRYGTKAYNCKLDCKCRDFKQKDGAEK